MVQIILLTGNNNISIINGIADFSYDKVFHVMLKMSKIEIGILKTKPHRILPPRVIDGYVDITH